MTLNSYRDPELRDRRSMFARHPLGTVLGVVFSAFLLLVPIGLRFGQSDHIVVRTAPLPGGVVGAGMLVEAATTGPTVAASTSTATTVAISATAAPVTDAPIPTAAATTEPVATTHKTVRPTTTVKRRPATTVAPKSATTAAKPKTTAATAAPKTTTTVAKAKSTTMPKPTPTTTVAPPTVYSMAQSEAVIRQVWPDDLEAQAVAVASRESTLHNTSHNYCCYGLFQINFAPHQQWLATLGISRPEQLYDPTVNATVAYRLYLVSGWAPWGG